jgi:hypothetical protein
MNTETQYHHNTYVCSPTIGSESPKALTTVRQIVAASREVDWQVERKK